MTRSGLDSIYIQARSVLFPFVGSLLLLSCSAGTRTSHTNDSLAMEQPSSPKPIETSEALPLITALEQAPLSPEAPAQRQVLTAWLFASPDIGELTPDDAYINEFVNAEHPYGYELFLQYMLGMAHSQAVKAGGKQDHVESGIRSLLATYKTLLAADESVQDSFLDRLDRIRQRGELREYIEEIDRRRRKR